MVHWMQRERLKNLNQIQSWLKMVPKDKKIDRDALIRKCVLVLGCTREKAREYIKDVMGEGEES